MIEKDWTNQPQPSNKYGSHSEWSPNHATQTIYQATKLKKLAINKSTSKNIFSLDHHSLPLNNTCLFLCFPPKRHHFSPQKTHQNLPLSTSPSCAGTWAPRGICPSCPPASPRFPVEADPAKSETACGEINGKKKTYRKNASQRVWWKMWKETWFYESYDFDLQNFFDVCWPRVEGSWLFVGTVRSILVRGRNHLLKSLHKVVLSLFPKCRSSSSAVWIKSFMSENVVFGYCKHPQ